MSSILCQGVTNFRGRGGGGSQASATKYYKIAIKTQKDIIKTAKKRVKTSECYVTGKGSSHMLRGVT